MRGTNVYKNDHAENALRRVSERKCETGAKIDGTDRRFITGAYVFRRLIQGRQWIDVISTNREERRYLAEIVRRFDKKDTFPYDICTLSRSHFRAENRFRIFKKRLVRLMILTSDETITDNS